MPLTTKAIAREIKRRFGYDVELVKGRGYLYFADAPNSPYRLSYWDTTSVMVNSLNQLTFDQWLDSFEILMDANQKRELSSGVSMDTKQSATISCDMSLFIRLLEVAREEIKSDADLHHLVERCSEAQALKDSPLTMDDYENLVGSPKAELNAATRLRAAVPNGKYHLNIYAE